VQRQRPKHALHRLQNLGAGLGAAIARRCCEAYDMHQTGLLITRSALAREESRGAHYRTDFPAPNQNAFSSTQWCAAIPSAFNKSRN